MSTYNFTDDRREELKGIAVPSSSLNSLVLLDTKGRMCRQSLGAGIPSLGCRIKQALPLTSFDSTLVAATEKGYLYTCRAADIPTGFWTQVFSSSVIQLGIVNNNSPFLLLISRQGDVRIVPTSVLERHEVVLPQRIAYISECDPVRHLYLDAAFTDGHALKLKIDKFFTSGKGKIFVPRDDFGYIAALNLSTEEERYTFFLNGNRGTTSLHSWMRTFTGDASGSKHGRGTRGGLFSKEGLTYFCTFAEGDKLLIDNAHLIDFAPRLLQKVSGTAIIPPRYWTEMPEIKENSLVVKIPHLLSNKFLI